MTSTHARRPAAAGSFKERPLPRLLQQLFRKQITGCLSITDQTGDLSEVYLRSGYPVHVHRPVDSDRLDRVLIENGVVTERAVEMAKPMVGSGMRLGEALERMGALSKQTLAEVLKAQVRRKITRLFCISEGRFEIFMEDHGYGEGDEWKDMRVDPRTLYYPAIRTAYDLPRVTRELSRLWGQQFRLPATSPSTIAAMQIPGNDPVVAALRAGWQTLEKVDPLAVRPVEGRAVLLALYYGDTLERQNLMEGADKSAAVASSTDNFPALSSGSGELPEGPGEPSLPEVIAEYVETPEPVEPPVVLAPPVRQGSPVSIPPSTPMIVSRPMGPPAPITPPPPIISPLSITQSAPAAPPANTIPPTPARRPSGSHSPDAPVISPSTPRFSPSPDIPVIHPSTPRFSPSPDASAKAPARTSPSPEGSKPRSTGSLHAVPVVDQALRTALTHLAQKLESLSFFELLDVPESAPASEISAAFFRAARRYHPDRLAGAGLSEMTPQAERVLARMSEAAMTLGDPAKRAAYVAERSGKKKAPESSIPSVVEAETAFLKGEVLLKKGDYSKAIECFTAACRANPSEPQFRAYLAWARFDNPKSRKESLVREVQRVITDAVSVQPKFARGHYWLGLIWKFLNEPDRAERCFREAVSNEQEFIEATRELRLCEMRRHRGGGPSKGPEPPRGGLMGRLFKR
jgi:tetratricopeptide (TPR) repeat protein